MPNQYNAQQENGEKDSDKQTNRLDDLSQSRSIYGIDEKGDNSPAKHSNARLTTDQEEAASRRAGNASRPRSGKATDLRRGAADREGVQRPYLAIEDSPTALREAAACASRKRTWPRR